MTFPTRMKSRKWWLLVGLMLLDLCIPFFSVVALAILFCLVTSSGLDKLHRITETLKKEVG